MSVKLDHRPGGNAPAVVISGVDSVDAIRYLCDSLEHGSGPDEPIVVLDLTGAAVAAEAAAPEIRRTVDSLAHTYRWLGIVEPVHAIATHGQDGWYTSAPAALAAGHRYAALVLGRRSVPSQF